MYINNHPHPVLFVSLFLSHTHVHTSPWCITFALFGWWKAGIILRLFDHPLHHHTVMTNIIELKTSSIIINKMTIKSILLTLQQSFICLLSQKFFYKYMQVHTSQNLSNQHTWHDHEAVKCLFSTECYLVYYKINITNLFHIRQNVTLKHRLRNPANLNTFNHTVYCYKDQEALQTSICIQKQNIQPVCLITVCESTHCYSLIWV